MKRGERWLSEGAESLAQAFEDWQAQPDGAGAEPPQFDVVVVGSGYGGAVAAQRLSALAEAEGRPAMRVAVLERGLEYTPGSFPDRLATLVGHLRMNGGGLTDMPANPEGLLDWRLGGDVGALVANGLGGGSLINAGVCEPADAEVFTRPAWPAPWLGNTVLWQRLYQRASQALGAGRWPALRVDKQWAMEALAPRLGATCLPVHLSIVPPAAGGQRGDQPGSDDAPPLRACIECGDCFTGCNVGAKRTLGHTYLARAHRQGARLFTGATVHSVLPLPAAGPGGPEGAGGPDDGFGPRWLLRWRLTDPGRLPGGQQFFELRARHVVLAAGTFGSTEILMRSRDAGLALSGRLGDGFSANGDVVSVFHRLRQPVGGSPDEASPLPGRRAGPTITQQLRWPGLVSDGVRGQRAVSHVLQDLTVPGALGWVFREVVTTMMVPQRWTRWNLAAQRPGDADPYAVDESAIGHSLLTVAYADDGAQGRLQPTVGWASAQRDGELIVRWKGLGELPALRAMDARLSAATPRGADYLRNPLWQFMPRDNYLGLGQTRRRLLTVHPLGGCRMATDARRGVVDPHGAVFNPGPQRLAPARSDGRDGGAGPDEGPDLAPAERAEQHRTEEAGQHHRRVHPGLYVLDGSIVPTALGINPLLTITALAEGAIDHWAATLGWVSAGRLPWRSLPALVLPPPPPATVVPPRPTAVALQERMHGLLRPLRGLDPAVDHRLSMRVRFGPVDDLATFLAQPEKTVPLVARLSVEIEPHRAPLTARPSAPRAVPGTRPLGLRGTVRWMAVEPSWVGQRLWRVVHHYCHHRLAADHVEARHFGRSLVASLLDLARGTSHFGAVRLLAYRFEPLADDWVLAGPPGSDAYTLPAGTVLFGAKRVGYLLPDSADPETANPWRQLSELPLQARLPDGQATPLATLHFDPMAALERYQGPIRVRDQQDAVSSSRDLAAMALYFGRLMFGLHMFSFRRPEYPAEVRGPRALLRLPPERYAADHRGFDRLRIDLHTLAVRQPLASADTPPLPLRLTRLRPAGRPRGLPVLLLHGFGSGGIQFTHPAIAQPLAPWLARQGRDVWVAELRTSIGLDSAHRQWTMDEVARFDIPALVDRVCQVSGQGQLQIVAHCIGSAMFCMAALGGWLGETGGGTQKTSKVAGAVLMQVGPQVELPHASRARATLANRLRQLVGATHASSVASQSVGDTESMLDRLFGTYLYPPDQRRHYRLGGDLQANTNRTNANRSAAVFGQLFQHENMPPELLAVMDDLLGDCNLTTYEQTAHYAFGHRLTNHAGEDCLVTDRRLRQYFDFPVLLMHGALNRTFHPRTLKRNAALLEAAGLDVREKLVPGHGHLDCVVGAGAADAVFGHILAQLDHADAQAPRSSQRQRPASAGELRLPSVGPWLGHVSRTADGQGLNLRLGVRVDFLGRSLLGVASQLCDGNEARGAPQHHPVDADHHETVVDTVVPAALAEGDAPLQLLVTTAHGQWPASGNALVGAVRDKQQRLKARSRRVGVAMEATGGLRLDRPWLRRMLEADPADLGLVLGACRQRPMLADRDLADRSMGHIQRQLDSPPPDGHVPIDALVLSGDQVYADTRIDLGHAGAARGRFLDAHQEAWSAPWQREVMRRRPVYMTVDDHEFRNDYNDQVAGQRPSAFAEARSAWLRYQIDAGPDRSGATRSWRCFELRGFAIFLCDTRSERCDPPRVARDGARIMRDDQMLALQAWLMQLHRRPGYGQRPKLIVTGTPIAPVFRVAQAPLGHALQSDGWQRFPDSVAQLLGFIAEQQIQNVVFLSGDYHRSADAELSLQPPQGPPVLARSIVTPGLYSPFPFVNVTPDEWLDGKAATGLAAGRSTWGYRLAPSAPGCGFTRLSLHADGRPVRSDFIAVLPGT